jgi:hypothetical protein
VPPRGEGHYTLALALFEKGAYEEARAAADAARAAGFEVPEDFLERLCSEAPRPEASSGGGDTEPSRGHGSPGP